MWIYALYTLSYSVIGSLINTLHCITQHIQVFIFCRPTCEHTTRTESITKELHAALSGVIFTRKPRGGGKTHTQISTTKGQQRVNRRALAFTHHFMILAAMFIIDIYRTLTGTEQKRQPSSVMTQSQTSSAHLATNAPNTPGMTTNKEERCLVSSRGRGLLSSRHTHLSTSERVNTARCLTSLNSLKVPAVMVTGWLVTGLKGSLHTLMMFYWYFSKFSYIFLMFL